MARQTDEDPLSQTLATYSLLKRAGDLQVARVIHADAQSLAARTFSADAGSLRDVQMITGHTALSTTQ
jgi:hypothetical protein